MKKSLISVLLFFALISVLAAAPKSLAVTIGGIALNGKALWYDEKVYVPLEAVADSLNGTYLYDESRGVASIDLGSRNPVKVSSAERARIVVLQDSTYATGDNLKVLATIENKGLAPARDLEITCTFYSTSRNELMASVAQLPELKPGERKTIEFWLFEQRLPDASGGRPYAQPMSIPSTYLGRNKDQVLLGDRFTRVTHDFNFHYLNPDDTYSNKPG